MAAAVGMIAGCQKPEMIQIAAPEDVKAPVLEALAGPIEITPTNMGLEKVTFSWSAADYGVATQVNYSLEAATAAAPADHKQPALLHWKALQHAYQLHSRKWSHPVRGRPLK